MWNSNLKVLVYQAIAEAYPQYITMCYLEVYWVCDKVYGAWCYIVSPAVHTFLPSVLQRLDPRGI